MASPPRGNTYDGPYWDKSSGKPRLTSIRKHFSKLAYAVKVGPWAMNSLGPAGSIEFENEDGTVGKLGGGDDKKSPIVKSFQIDYNIVSRAKTFVGGMGTLKEDGFVGNYTLNGLRYVTEKIGGKHWPDIVKEAKNKGIPKQAVAMRPPSIQKAVMAMPGSFPTEGGTADDGDGGGGGGGTSGGASAKKKSSAMPLLAGAAVLLLVMAKK